MRTVYAKLPENPNITLRLNVPSEDKHAKGNEERVFEKHFARNSSPVGLLYSDPKDGFGIREVESATIRGMINVVQSLWDDLGDDKSRVDGTNSIVVNAIKLFEGNADVSNEIVKGWLEETDLEEANKDNVETVSTSTRRWLQEQRKKVVVVTGVDDDAAPLPVEIFLETARNVMRGQQPRKRSTQQQAAPTGRRRDDLSRDDDPVQVSEKQVINSSNALTATLQEAFEVAYSTDTRPATWSTYMDDAIRRYNEDKNMIALDSSEDNVRVAVLKWWKTRKIRSSATFEQDVTFDDSGQVQPSSAIAPLVQLSEEARFVRRLENNLDEVMRRALLPLYSFVGGIAVALSDRDVRPFYKYKNQRGVTVDELQSPVKRGSSTLIEFYEANKHLGNLILQYAVEVQIGKDRIAKRNEELKLRKEQAKQQRQQAGSLIGARDRYRNFNFAGIRGVEATQGFVKAFRAYARGAALMPADESHPDVADWYWCAMPYAVFHDLLNANLLAAMEMAASDIWRFTGREDFTIPLMIKSKDTRDVFVLMTRNKYIISTGTVYSDSLYVSQGGRGGVSKRYQTGSGSIIREKRAAENLAGKYWWQDVVLVKDDSNKVRYQRLQSMQQRDRDRVNQLKEHIRLAKRHAELSDVAFVQDVDDALEQVEQEIRQLLGQEEEEEDDLLGLGLNDDDIEDVLNDIRLDSRTYIRKTEDEREDILLRLKCYDTMMYELKYLRKPARYGGGSFLKTRRGGMYSY